MFLIGLIFWTFMITMSKELISSNEERVIVTSLILVLIMLIVALKDTSNEFFYDSINAMCDEIKYFFVSYFNYIKAFENLCRKNIAIYNSIFDIALNFLLWLNSLVNKELKFFTSFLNLTYSRINAL